MRLFLAMDLPDSVRETLSRLQARLRASCPGWRWVSPLGIHLTLRFLGEVSAQQDETRRPVWREACLPFGPLRLRLGAPGVFPGGRHPRVLWVGVDEVVPGRSLVALAGALETAAREHGFASEDRSFRAHLTLARAGREGASPRVPPQMERLDNEWDCNEVVLFRSELLPGGARYTALERFPLGGESGRES